MSHGTEDVLRQLRAGEDSAWEFMQVEFTGNRPVRPSRDDWADEIAAFANARGGVLLCGVTDDGEAQGMSREQIVALDALLVEIGTDSIKPAVRIHTWHRMLPEGERVLLLEVPESDSQHDSSGVHRDYSIRASRIRLSMFSDRIEIQSPGALPNNLTVDDMPHRQATRNELLTSLLGRVSAAGIKGAGGRLFVIERRGDGVPIMRRETRELSGKLPEFRLIAGSELCVSIPAASLEFSPARAVVTVRCGDRPLPGVELLVLFPNKTWKRAITDENGEAGVDLHTTALPMTVFAAAPGYSAHLERAWTPSRGTLALGLHELPGGGAVIFPEATGALPGLSGRLNPIRDSHDRTYLYASNIAVNQGQPQPVHFIPGEDLRLTDADGREVWARIIEVTGRSALVEYRPVAGR